MAKVYGWMTLALAITGVVAFALQGKVPNELVMPLFLVQIGLVIAIAWGMRRISAGAATALFIIYAALMGVTMSVIFTVYTTGDIAAAFFATGGTFGVMSLIGWVTKRDLTKFGGFLLFALIGVVIATVVGIFIQAAIITFIWLYVGLLVFMGLTVYETWLLKKTAAAAVAGGAATERKFAILGALSLYLNFINIFIRMLAIFR